MLDQVLAVAVVILPTLFAVSIEVVSKEIREHPYWRIGVLSFGLGLSALTWFQISRADQKAQADRQDVILETSEKVSARVSESVSKSVTKSLTEQYTQTINGLNVQIGSLQNQLQQQSKSVEAIKGSNIVSGKNPIRVEVTNPPVGSAESSRPEIHASSMETAPNPEFGRYATQVILTTIKE